VQLFFEIVLQVYEKKLLVSFTSWFSFSVTGIRVNDFFYIEVLICSTYLGLVLKICHSTGATSNRISET